MQPNFLDFLKKHRSRQDGAGHAAEGLLGFKETTPVSPEELAQLLEDECLTPGVYAGMTDLLKLWIEEQAKEQT